MIVTDMKGYAFYATKDRSRVETVMDGDNDGHGRAWSQGMERINEVEYWLIRLKQDREERDRLAIEAALRLVKLNGYSHGVD
jgi:hypothetical protein